MNRTNGLNRCVVYKKPFDETLFVILCSYQTIYTIFSQCKYKKPNDFQFLMSIRYNYVKPIQSNGMDALKLDMRMFEMIKWCGSSLFFNSCFVCLRACLPACLSACLFTSYIPNIAYIIIHWQYSKIIRKQTWFSKAPINHDSNCANPLHISLLNVKRILLLTIQHFLGGIILSAGYIVYAKRTFVLHTAIKNVCYSLWTTNSICNSKSIKRFVQSFDAKEIEILEICKAPSNVSQLFFFHYYIAIQFKMILSQLIRGDKLFTIGACDGELFDNASTWYCTTH